MNQSTVKHVHTVSPGLGFLILFAVVAGLGGGGVWVYQQFFFNGGGSGETLRADAKASAEVNFPAAAAPRPNLPRLAPVAVLPPASKTAAELGRAANEGGAGGSGRTVVVAGAAATEEAHAVISVRAGGGEQAETLPDALVGEVHKEVLGVVPGVMQYDKKELTAKAGERVAIFFMNPECPLQHNFLLCKPGTDAAIGKLSDEMLQKDAAGALAKAYVPESPDIVVAGKNLLGPGQSEIIQFTVPDVAGDYPYVCTFPGHRFLMKGVLKVAK